MRCASSALSAALRVAKAGQPINAIGAAVVEGETHCCGFRVIREFSGHGLGRVCQQAMPQHPQLF